MLPLDINAKARVKTPRTAAWPSNRPPLVFSNTTSAVISCITASTSCRSKASLKRALVVGVGSVPLITQPPSHGATSRDSCVPQSATTHCQSCAYGGHTIPAVRLG